MLWIYLPRRYVTEWLAAYVSESLEYDLDHIPIEWMGGRSESKEFSQFISFLAKIRNKHAFSTMPDTTITNVVFLTVKIRANLDANDEQFSQDRVDLFKYLLRLPAYPLFPDEFMGVLMILCAVLHKCEQNRHQSRHTKIRSLSAWLNPFSRSPVIIIGTSSRMSHEAGQMSREKQMFMYWRPAAIRDTFGCN